MSKKMSAGEKKQKIFKKIAFFQKNELKNIDLRVYFPK